MYTGSQWHPVRCFDCLLKTCQIVFTALRHVLFLSDIGFEIPDKFVVGYALVSVTYYQSKGRYQVMIVRMSKNRTNSKAVNHF